MPTKRKLCALFKGRTSDLTKQLPTESDTEFDLAHSLPRSKPLRASFRSKDEREWLHYDLMWVGGEKDSVLGGTPPEEDLLDLPPLQPPVPEGPGEVRASGPQGPMADRRAVRRDGVLDPSQLKWEVIPYDFKRLSDELDACIKRSHEDYERRVKSGKPPMASSGEDLNIDPDSGA